MPQNRALTFIGWGLLFQMTAILTLIIDAIDAAGCWISMEALKPIQHPEKVI